MFNIRITSCLSICCCQNWWAQKGAWEAANPWILWEHLWTFWCWKKISGSTKSHKHPPSFTAHKFLFCPQLHFESSPLILCSVQKWRCIRGKGNGEQDGTWGLCRTTRWECLSQQQCQSPGTPWNWGIFKVHSLFWAKTTKLFFPPSNYPYHSLQKVISPLEFERSWWKPAPRCCLASSKPLAPICAEASFSP